MSKPRPFHRQFEYAWLDFFEGTEVDVEVEVDLSAKKQLIDLIIIRKDASPIPWRLPDGFEVLATYNLLTFKSYQEAMDARALHELIGHYINYCKRVSPSLDDLLPAEEFRLFAVSARYPANLAKETALTKVMPGVYDVTGFGLTIRVIVAGELREEEHNAMLHLFSAREELIRYGQEHYRPRSTGTSSLLDQLFRQYSEDPIMSEKLREYQRKGLEEMLARIPPEELRKALPPEERLKDLPAEERLKGLPPEERLKGLSSEEVLKALTPEVREALVRQLKENGSAPKLE